MLAGSVEAAWMRPGCCCARRGGAPTLDVLCVLRAAVGVATAEVGEGLGVGMALMLRLRGCVRSGRELVRIEILELGFD